MPAPETPFTATAPRALERPAARTDMPLPLPLRLVQRAAGLIGAARSVPRTEHPRAAARALRIALRGLADVHGLDIRRVGEFPSGPFLAIANHLGVLDPVVIASLVECAPVAKAEVFSWPFIGGALARGGGIRVARGDVESGASALRQMRARWDAGVPVLLFPEGTTTRGPLPGPFIPGGIALAARLGVPVVPVGLSYDDTRLVWVDDTPFLSHYVRLAAGRRHGVTVRVGAVLRAPRDASPEVLARRARSAVAALCALR